MALPTPKKEPEYRYFCDRCTGVAFLSIGNEPKNPPHNCGNCGLPIGEIKPENFLLLEANHPARKPTATLYK